MAKISKGDLVKISFTGRTAAGSAVIETTDAAVAKEAGIWSDASAYGPRLVVYGRGAMIAGIEEALLKLDAGKEGKFSIKAEKAFGPKFNELVRVMPEKDFLKQGIRPSQDLVVSIDGVPARIKSVASGRIMLDFNHPLAGEDLEYVIELHEVVSEPAAKAKALGALFGLEVEIDSAKKTVIFRAGANPGKARGLEGALRAALGEGWKISVKN